MQGADHVLEGGGVHVGILVWGLERGFWNLVEVWGCLWTLRMKRKVQESLLFI